MRITKYGHACLLIEEGDARIVTDPGGWSPVPDAENVDAVLITHEHGDHIDMEKLRALLLRNPSARVLTQEAVGKLLAAEGIAYEELVPGQSVEVKGVEVVAVGEAHEAIYGGVSPCRNSGYYFAGKLFVPGDALHDVPPGPVEVLGLPTGAPWMRLSEAIDYAKRIAPKEVFPLHDAMYVESYRDELIPRIVGGNLEAAGIKFRNLPPGASLEF